MYFHLSYHIYILYISQLVVVSMVLAIGPSLHNRATGRPQVLMARPWGRWMAVCCSPAVSMRCVWASNWKAQRHVVYHHCIIVSSRSHILYIYISIDARVYMHMCTYIYMYAHTCKYLVRVYLIPWNQSMVFFMSMGLPYRHFLGLGSCKC
jgi:hypothetical protein